MRPLYRFLIPTLALAALSSVPAFASPIDYFTLTDTTDNNVFTFSLPSSPAVSAYNADIFAVNLPTLEENGVAQTNGRIDFYTASYGGGLQLRDGQTLQTILAATNGDPVFSGPTSAPTFDLGTYSEKQDNGWDKYTLNISPTPEPSSIVLLGTGLLAMAGAARRRFVL